MPELIDFTAITNRLVDQLLASHPHDEAILSGSLVLVWNARGAVDLIKLDHTLSALMGTTKVKPFVQQVTRALRTLDR